MGFTGEKCRAHGYDGSLVTNDLRSSAFICGSIAFLIP
jgi:hypothetical protein